MFRGVSCFHCGKHEAQGQRFMCCGGCEMLCYCRWPAALCVESNVASLALAAAIKCMMLPNHLLLSLQQGVPAC
jgi:hypothetical protein